MKGFGCYISKFNHLMVRVVAFRREKREVSTNQSAALATGNRLQGYRISSRGDLVVSSWERAQNPESSGDAWILDNLQEMPLPSRIRLASGIRGPSISAVSPFQRQTCLYLCVSIFVYSLCSRNLLSGSISCALSANNLFYDVYVFYYGR